jgi:hypothetical protein
MIKSAIISIRLSTVELERLQAEATERCTTISGLVRERAMAASPRPARQFTTSNYAPNRITITGFTTSRYVTLG